MSKDVASASCDSRIDPSQLPSASLGSWPECHKVVSLSCSPPVSLQATASAPSACLRLCAKDEGEATPRYVRTTTHGFARRVGVLGHSGGLPVGIVTTPLASPTDGESAIPVVPQSSMHRCVRCHAYISSHARFVRDGREWICPFCRVSNDVPSDYFCHIDSFGTRRDIDEHPELQFGSVEYSLGYVKNRPKNASVIFVVDTAMSREFLTAFIEGNIIDRITCPFAVIFFGVQNVFFFPQSGGVSIMGDLVDPFLPFPVDKLLFSPSEEGKNNAREILSPSRVSEAIGDMEVSLLQDPETRCKRALVPGIRCGDQLASESSRIVVVMSHTGLPSRDRPDDYGTDKELEMMKPDQNFENLARRFSVDRHVGVSLFICATESVDVASVSLLASRTGGRMYYYYPFSPSRHWTQFCMELQMSAEDEKFGRDVIFLVRASTGIGVKYYYPAGKIVKGSDEVRMGVMSPSTSLAVELDYEEGRLENDSVCLQCALRYQTSKGEVRIRVHTLSRPIVETEGPLFRSADCDAMTFFLFARAIAEGHKGSQQLGPALESKVVAILSAYRRYCTQNPSPGQLILPESLKRLPLYTISLVKNLLPRRIDGPLLDERIYLVNSLLYDCSLSEFLLYCYPRLYQLMGAEERVGTMYEGQVLLPPILPLTVANVNSGGLFALCNGHEIILYVGSQIPEDVLLPLFGTNQVDNIDVNLCELRDFPESFIESSAGRVLAQLLSNEDEAGRHMNIRVVKETDPSSSLFFVKMVEDRMHGMMSYVEYLCHIHRVVIAAMQKQDEMLFSSLHM